jgi:hypothetical protein
MRPITRPILSPRRSGARPRSRGQAVVEFALILPVFLLMTLGVVDMARLFTSYIALTNGVSNAAIYAGQGGFLKWCASGSPITGAGCTTVAQQVGNPDNIAYQLQVESTGLTLSGISLDAPLCTVAATAATENCTSITANRYSQVKIGAHYDVTLFTPLVGAFLGGPIHLSAATTAVVQ